MMAIALPIDTKRARVPTPSRIGMATSIAHGPSFQQLSRTGSYGIKIASGKAFAPFTGPDAEAYKLKWSRYSYSAQYCINRALLEPSILEVLGQRSLASAPELVVLGDALLRQMTLGHDLFYQTPEFIDTAFTPSGSRFKVDIMKTPRGDKWLESVDGAHWHEATIEAILHDMLRDGQLGEVGHAIAISDQVCFSREALHVYLDSRGAP